MSFCSFEEVSTTTGMLLVRAAALTRRSTSRPSTFGSFRSSRMTLGACSTLRPACCPSPKMNSSASAPSRATWMRLVSLLLRKARRASSRSSGLSSTSSISTAFVSFIIQLSFHREIKCGAAIKRGFRPNTTAVTMNNPLHNRQADAGAFKFLSPMQSLEHAEQFVGVLHVKAGAVIGNEIDFFAVIGCRSYFDQRRRAFATVFDRVRNQIHPNLFQQCRIAFARRQLADANVDLMHVLLSTQFLERFAGQFRHVDRLRMQREPAQSRERQQIVDEHPHSLRGTANGLQIMLTSSQNHTPAILYSSARLARHLTPQ